MEFSCLKALLLFNDDNAGLKNVKQVEQVTVVKAKNSRLPPTLWKIYIES